ncbi:MAG: ABC transporter substrate-binding protein [Bacteroidota bacterium]
MKIRLHILLGLALAGVLWSAFDRSSVPSVVDAYAVENGVPIVIAHVAPTTGRFALHAEADRRGAEMAIDEFNARGGVIGREVVLVSRDPSLDERQAARVAEELISGSKVGFLVGAVSSGVAASMSAVCQKHGVIFINTNSSATSESIENAHRSKFVFDAHGANFYRALIKHALANRRSKRVLLLTEDNTWGHDNAAATRQYIAESGGKVVGEVLAPETLPDPLGVLRRVAAIPADVVVTSISGDNQIKLFAQIDPQTLERQSWVVGEVDWEELYPAPGTPRPLFGTTWAWNLGTPGSAEFVSRYRKRYGHTKLDYPGDVTHAAYLATGALLDAIERAGTTDSHAVIRQLEKYRRSAGEGMQNADAYMDPVSHHVQQSIYIARWNPRAARPELGLEILGHVPPEQSRFEREKTTVLESMSETPHYQP